MGGFAWVTLATNDSYSLGALVLAHSLRQVNTAHQLAVLVTPGVTSLMREKLASVFNVVKEVNVLDSRDEANLRLLKRPELGITFTKLHCWRLTQFDKCVFLDADTMVLANCDELFDREEFSAAPDVGWPDCFNSGVFVYQPSEETYSNLVKFALDKGSFDGGDQGLLNLYFSDWAHKDISKHLPFIYNMCSTACYSYLPAFKQFGGNVKIIHFIGNSKPWLQYFDTETQHVQVVSDIQHLQGVVQQWWNIFCSCIHPTLSPEMAGLAGAFARLTIGVPRTPEQAMLEDQLRRQGWEVGNIDYMGRDSFDNIWSKISETLSAGPSPSQPPSVPPVEGPSDAVPKEEAVQAISEVVHVPAEKPVETPKAQTEETVPTPTEAVSQVVSDTFTPPATAQSVEDTQTPISTPTQAEIQSQQSSVQLQEMPKPEIKEVLPTPETPKSVSLASDPLQSFSEPPSVEPNENLSTVEASILPATLPSESSTIQLPDPVSSKPQQDKPSVTECPRAVSTPVSELPKEASKSDSSVAIQESPKTPESSKPTPVSDALVQKPVLPEPPKQDDKPKPTPDPSKVVASSEPNKPGPPESSKLSKPTPVSEGSEQKPALPESPKPLAAKQEDKPKIITPDPSIVPASSEVKKPSTPESPKTPSSQSPKQAPLGKTSVETSKQGALKSEPEKPSEAPKPKEPSAKVSAKSAPPKSGDSPATEQAKASVPKVAAAAPQKLPQSTPKETSEEGPTPPPRKSTGGGAAGGKKSAKSKK